MWLAKLFEVGVKASKVSGTYGFQWSNEASQAHTHDSTRPAKAATEGGTVCKKLRQPHRIQTLGPQTSTPTPKLILRVATQAWKMEKLCWRKKKYIGCVFVREVFFTWFSILIAHNQKDFVPNAPSYL